MCGESYVLPPIRPIHYSFFIYPMQDHFYFTVQFIRKLPFFSSVWACANLSCIFKTVRTQNNMLLTMFAEQTLNKGGGKTPEEILGYVFK